LEIKKYIIRSKHYEGCTADFENADVVLFGAGFDGTSSYRPGSRFAPNSIRNEAYYFQEDYSPYFQEDLKNKKIHDLGDVEIIFGNKEKSLDRIETISRFIMQNNKIPVCIGGEHLITYPIVKAVYEMHPDLHIIQLDAHLDAMDELFGEKFSHGTVIRRIYDLIQKPNHIYQVGIRSGSWEEFQFAETHTRLFLFNTINFINSIDELSNKPIYLTLDVDVFDPSLLPGTGTPEAGGIFFQEYIELLRKIKQLNIVGADIVELSPYIDSANVSAIVASKVLRELLIILGM